jgi:hypothetical protein
LVIKYSVIYPEEYNAERLPAGVVSTLADQIIEFSAFASAKTAKSIMQDKRVHASQVRSLMKAFVLATIHTETPESLDELTFSQLAEKVALSEKIIEIKQAINGMEPTNVTLALIDPEEEEEKKKEAIARFEKARKEGEARVDDPIAHKLWGSA